MSEKAFAAIVRDYVARSSDALMRKIDDSLAEILERVSGVEKRAMVPGPAGRDGIDGKDGAPGQQGEPGARGTDGRDADPEVIKTLVADAVAKIPAPKDGERGEKGDAGDVGPQGERGADGAPGLNGKDVDPSVIDQMVAAAVASIPAPKDGAPGKDGRDATIDFDVVVRSFAAELEREEA
jgi:hypothetical protein